PELNSIELINAKQTANLQDNHSGHNQNSKDANIGYTSLDSFYIYAFERSFKFNLILNPNGIFLSPDLWLNQQIIRKDNVSTNSNSPYSDCLFNGRVDNQIESLLCLNLCHKGRISGSFTINDEEYFLEPIEEFDSKSYKLYEFSFVDFENSSKFTETHFLFKKKSNETKNQTTYESSATEVIQSAKIKLNDTHKRKKRESNFFLDVVDRRVFLELLVVVDRQMYDFYGENLNNHIITLLFMTTQLYQHPTLINPIRVYISDIIYEHEIEEPSYREETLKKLGNEWEAEKLLSKFCRWQYNYRKWKNINKQIDVAILITKRDICKSKDVCETLGIARLNQVCVPYQNCAVIEDSGLNTAYTIAHEIGHLLGMKHVDEERCKNLNNSATQMMAAMLDLTKKTQVWSNCSVIELNDFLRAGDGECLFNIPSYSKSILNSSLNFENTLEQFDDNMIKSARYPGYNNFYSLKNQCQQIFGIKSDKCDHNPEEDCKILWCKADSPKSNAYQCVTTNTKWADGTPCRTRGSYNGDLCLNGECVNPKNKNNNPVDGGFSEWSEFTSCSRSCGGGVRKRYRTCDNPEPKNGGKYCVGKRVWYESCNTQNCELKEVDFRDEQCRVSAKKTSNVKLADQMGFSITNANLEWKAYYSSDPRRKCLLFCHIEEKSTFALLSPIVIDGTKCSLDSHDICVNGHCLPGGCDNILYSNKSEDKCGICGGENKSCDEKHFEVKSPNKFGYNFLATLPAKTTSIYIHRYKESDDLGCLSIRSHNKALLNGHYVISKTSTTIDFEGKLIDYIVNETVEIIQSRGNFTQDLIVSFLSSSKIFENKISFKYFVPKPEKEEKIEGANYWKSYASNYGQQHNLVRSDTYVTDMVESDCDKICNGRKKISFKQCTGYFCKEQERFESCNTHCSLNLTYYSVGCTAFNGVCGEGWENLRMQCMLSYENSDSKFKIDLGYCDQKDKIMVSSLKKECLIPCENYEWRTLDIQCNCEDGFKKPNFICYEKKFARIVSPINCVNVAKPDTSKLEKCDQKCYEWRASDWYDCSKTCGAGERKRNLYCVFNKSHIVSRYLCDTEKMPNEFESCNMHSCPFWLPGSWNECIGTCEKGKRNRTLYCMYQDKKAEESLCVDLARPQEEEECELAECFKWKTNDWSECSATCGVGYQTRSITCQLLRKEINRFSDNQWYFRISSDVLTMENADDSKCDSRIKPLDQQECFSHLPCPEWRTTKWSYCNCNSGLRKRFVYCSSNIQSDCPIKEKPASFENCTCSGFWKVSRWSECSGGCNFGWEHRNVTCVDRQGQVLNPLECLNRSKPKNRRRCFDCSGEWRPLEWNECSTTCGKGIQIRNIECFSPESGSILPIYKCDTRLKPIQQRTCFVKNCTGQDYEWKIVSIRPCPVTCGYGWRFRSIECRTNDGHFSDKCRNEDRPDYYEKCDVGPCPSWEYGHWSACSTQCGNGIRERLVACRFQNGTFLDDDNCDQRQKPINKTSCSGNFCANWISGNWSDCELETCSRIRKVYCAFENGTILSDENCNLKEKPGNLIQCPSWITCNRYQSSMLKSVMTTSLGILHYSEYSKCSTKCGLGYRNRSVSCRSITNDSIELPMKFCDSARIERLQIDCQLAMCNYKLIESWGKCSAKCGQAGTEQLEKKCFETITKSYVNLSHCETNRTDSITERKCYKPCTRHAEPSYQWRISSWKPCSAKCGFGQKNRLVKCWSLTESKVTDDSNCILRYKPVDSLPCINISCGYGWFVSEWSSCSKSCSEGVKTREVTCMKISIEGLILKTTSIRCNQEEKPTSIMPCNFGECDSEYFWKTGPWSKCSPSCNIGQQSRQIYCYHKNGKIEHDYSKCKQDFMPIRHQFCFTNCYVNSCKELKQKFNLDQDNDYYLNISNSIVQIYCKDMHTSEPKEFITLKSGESRNFAEIYDKKLIHPTKCRYGPRYGADCSFCESETVENHGITLFSKVRLNISSLSIIGDDFSFTNVLYGNLVPFGNSGDCYSLVPECQQGRLNIDLRGTNFVLDPSTKWINYGENPNQKIYFSKDNSIIYGTCGGFCGFCKPDPSTGIKLLIVED
ncbi:A disintegrin and metallo ase with thrombospondin motifs 20, partial [Brachionus plicatilis]